MIYTDIEETSYVYYRLTIDLRNVDIFSRDNGAIHVARCWPVDYFLWLYNTIGRDYKWWYYNYKTDAELHDYLNNNTKEYITLMHDGMPAGMAIIKYDHSGGQIDKDENCNLEYFGLLPHAIGKGVGKKFLYNCVQRAAIRADNMWVYTTSFDHPAALTTYKSVGFQITERKTVSEYFPQQC